MMKSYSKINLFLRVLKKNIRGLHDIQSTTMLLTLHDKIIIKKIKKNKDVVVFNGPFKKNINTKLNTITSTLSLLRSQNLINPNKKYKIIINKQIPVFAGLGGGTGNAAAVIKYFLKKKLNIKLLKIFEKKYKFYFLLIYPNIKCSTKKVYSQVKKFNSPLKIDPSKILIKEKYNKFLISQDNDLQKIVEKKHKNIQNILRFIKFQKNCILSRMTGSGSVCFGIFFNRKSANLAVKVLKKKFPKYWCVLTKSI